MTFLGRRIGEADRTEEKALTGFREWQADLHGCLLAFGSQTADVWRPESVAVAECRAMWTPGWRPHTAPAAECRCGLHARTDLGRSADAGRFHGAIGAVCAWGRIVLHERGFRAQYARPIGLLATGEELVRRAAMRYRLPVLSREELIAYAMGDLPLESERRADAVVAVAVPSGRREAIWCDLAVTRSSAKSTVTRPHALAVLGRVSLREDLGDHPQ